MHPYFAKQQAHSDLECRSLLGSAIYFAEWNKLLKSACVPMEKSSKQGVESGSSKVAASQLIDQSCFDEVQSGY